MSRILLKCNAIFVKKKTAMHKYNFTILLNDEKWRVRKHEKSKLCYSNMRHRVDCVLQRDRIFQPSFRNQVFMYKLNTYNG